MFHEQSDKDVLQINLLNCIFLAFRRSFTVRQDTHRYATLVMVSEWPSPGDFPSPAPWELGQGSHPPHTQYSKDLERVVVAMPILVLKILEMGFLTSHSPPEQ